jgi:glutamate carboxypeptidase
MPDLRRAARQQAQPYLETLKALVLSESPSHGKAACDALADLLEARLRRDGWDTTRTRQDEVGDQLIARLEAPGKDSTLLLAHYDTVWPVGTLKRMPFKQDGDPEAGSVKVYGPGVLDMKAGVATALHAPLLARELNLALRGPVTLLLTSDEELGSLRSRALIEELAKEYARVLVLEPGRDDGALKIGRKGVGDFYVAFTGRSAHAGNDPQSGASALRELAHFLLYVEGLNDEEAGTSVSLTVAEGGSASNVIAEEAKATVDVRVLKQSEAERLGKAINGYKPHDARVEVRVSGGLNRPPMERTEWNQQLFELARRCAATWGTRLQGAVVGGGSDGNFTSALGVPTLDGLGSVGAGPHARHEHIRLEETLERLALVTALLTVSPEDSHEQ